MPLPAPILDDRRFADLVAEARTRIPRYTPEWTDLNDNDPGIALVQLFAWLSETLLFRLARVPDLHYVKFLQLLGIDVRPAEPARAEITFPLVEAGGQAVVIIPRETQVAVAADEPIVFETDESLIAIAARLVQVQTFDGANYQDVTPPDDGSPGDPFLPFGPSAAVGNALLLGFAYPDKYTGPKTVFPHTQLNLTFFAHDDATGPNAVSCSAPNLRPFASAILAWEYWDRTAWRALSVDKDSTLAMARDGHILLRTPSAGMIQLDRIGLATKDRFWIRARVDRAGYERAPALDAVLINTIGATQAQTQRQEILGGATGQPNQLFKLAFAPVLAGALTLEIDEGEGFVAWSEVDDFLGSGPDDNHFLLDRATGEIRFGDGDAGRIPIANINNPDANIVADIYRYGGGKKGNVAAGAIANLSSVLAGVDAGKLRNVRPSSGGRDEETLQHALDRGPEQLKNKDRAVTPSDYEQLARNVPGIARAKALPLYHPSFPQKQTPGAVSVLVVPDADNPAPVPSEGLLRSVCVYLEPRRMLTAEVYVLPPKYHQVTIQATVIASGDADVAEVKGAVEERLLTYFHPLKGGENWIGWDFGGKIFFSLVYRQVLAVEGVSRIDTLTIVLDGVAQPACQDVALEADTLAFSTEHSLIVIYEGDTP